MNPEQLLLAPATARSRRHDPPTSRAAAASVTPETMSRAQREVYDQLRLLAQPDHDLVLHLSHLPISESRIRTSRKELVDAGLVECVGEAVTPFGRSCKVWKAVR